MPPVDADAFGSGAFLQHFAKDTTVVEILCGSRVQVNGNNQIFAELLMLPPLSVAENNAQRQKDPELVTNCGY